MTEHDSTQSNESESSPERALSVVDTLPSRLGIEYTPELTDARTQAIEAAKRTDAEARKTAFIAHRIILEDQVEAMPQDYDRPPTERRFVRGQMGMDIAQVLIWREAGDLARYVEEVEQVSQLAYSLGFEQENALLRDELAKYAN